MFFIAFYPVFACLIGFLVFKLFSVYIKNSLYKQKSKLAEVAIDILEELNVEEMMLSFLSPEKIKNLEPELKAQIAGFIHEKMPEKLPALAMFKGDKLMFKAEEIVMEEVRHSLPEIIQKSANGDDYKKQIQELVKLKTNAIPSVEWEGLVNYWISPFLGKIQMAGAVLGFILGVAYIFFMFLYNFIFLS